MNKQEELNGLFAQAKVAPVVASFEETKMTFVNSLLAVESVSISAKTNVLSHLKFWIMLVSSISIVGVSVWLMFPTETINKSTDNKVVKKETFTEEKSNIVHKENDLNDKATIAIKSVNNDYKLPITLLKLKEIKINRVMELQSPLISKFVNVPHYKPSEPYFPKLTEQEIAANHKQKKKMIKALAKFDSKTYSYIPAGSFDYNGQTVSVQSFFIQQTEVSNLEYRTFLFDLIIQGRKDEFLLACPDQAQWSKYANQEKNPYEEYYFSHPAYDNYPVVNISRKGAEMYCIWLTKETKATLKEGEMMNDVRIPTRIEWVKAASNEGQQLPYSWNEQLTRNSEGIYLANYKMSAEEYAKIDSTLSVNMKANSKDLTAPVRSYFPNALGLYNMCGNVAEMVYNAQIGDKGFQMKIDGNGTAGGSWMNTAEEIKIYSPDPFKDIVDPNTGIGFRVVITHLGRKTMTPIN